MVYSAYSLFRPIEGGSNLQERFASALVWAVPISVLAGFLGIGPGFLLMPTLILLGFEPKRAAAINAFAVTPPSFSALIPHLGTAVWDPALTMTLILVGAGGGHIRRAHYQPVGTSREAQANVRGSDRAYDRI